MFKHQPYNRKAFIGLLLGIFSFFGLMAQCPTGASFVIKESRCKENGSITINVTPAGTYTYEIISGPELAALSSSNVFNGLGAGNYIISVYGSGCSASYAVTVPGNYQDPGLLLASTTNIKCPGGTGCINTDQPTNGRPPYRYSIVGGPVTRPLQASTSFCGLPEGFYTVNALDSCGVVRTSQFNIANDTGNFYGYAYGWDIRFANCTDLILRSQAEFEGSITDRPLKIWYLTPTGDTLKVNDFAPQRTENVDTLPGMAHTYGVWKAITFDECGRQRTSDFDFFAPTTNTTVFYDATCGGIGTLVRNNWYEGLTVGVIIRRCSDNSIVFTNTALPNTSQWWAGITTLDYNECYIVETFNECGDTVRNSISTPARGLRVEACGSASCNNLGKARISLFLQDASNVVMPVTYTIIAGPADVGRYIVNSNQWMSESHIEDITPGIYTVVAQNGCGDTDTLVVDASRGLKRTINITQTPHCSGGSNVHITINSNRIDCRYEGLYGASPWMLHTVQGTTPSYTPYNENYYWTNSADNEGAVEMDFLDVRSTSLTLTIGAASGDGTSCTFDTTISINRYVPPTLQDITGYVCTSSGVSTINYKVNGGVAPYRFRIKPDASSTWGAWQDSSVFTGLAVGTYDINVEDACPNGSIRSVNFLQWQKSPISISNPCATIGSPVTLRAEPSVNFVSYQWLFNNTVVGTGATYTIPSYNTTNQGTYKLKQTFRGGTCVDSTTTILLTCSILPLTMSGFSGEFSGNNVTLRWKTLADITGMQFVIERSTDGVHFKKIGTSTSNNLSEGSNYQFVDNNPASKNFYRIAYYTDPGTMYYSNVIQLSKNASYAGNPTISIVPVPFNNKLQVQVQSKRRTELSIKLFDVLGKKVAEKKASIVSGSNTIVLETEINQLTSGYYFIEISGDQIMHREKIMKD